MTHGTVVMVGDLGFETRALNRLVTEFGWSLELAAGLDELRELSAVRHSIAILFDANSLGLSWEQALASLREIDSQALLIPCHRFSDAVNWRELADAGAFHALALPFDPGEVRQSLGFIWSARFRRAAQVLNMRRAEKPEAVAGSQRAGRVKRVSESVA